MDDTLHYLIMANQMLVQKALLEQLKDTGLTIGQPKILDYLKDHDGSNQKEIAKACFLEAGSLTTILNKMEEKGLIERRILNGNRRSFHIFMTEEGKKKQQLVTQAFAKIEEKALSGVSAEEFQQFLAVYGKIYANLQGKEMNKLKRYLFFWVNPGNYAMKLAALLAGCIVLGYGVYLEPQRSYLILP